MPSNLQLSFFHSIKKKTQKKTTTKNYISAKPFCLTISYLLLSSIVLEQESLWFFGAMNVTTTPAVVQIHIPFLCMLTVEGKRERTQK